MSDEHDPDRYYGYDRPDAVGVTTYHEEHIPEPVLQRDTIVGHATGEAVFHYRPVEHSPIEVLAEGQWSPEQGWDAGTEWSDVPTDDCNIDTMYTWVAHMSDERTFALADAWSQAASVLQRTALALRLRAEALAATWQSPAAEEFLVRVGAALASLDEWRDVAADNASGLRRIAEVIQDAQDPDHLPRVYAQYRERAAHIAYQRADEAQLWREDPDSEHARERANIIRYEAIGLAREEYHHEAMRYTRPIADAYTEVRFTLLGQGRRYEGPVLPDLGLTRMDAALSALRDEQQRRAEAAMAALSGLGATPTAAPPMPALVSPPAIPSTLAPQLMGMSAPPTPSPVSPPPHGSFAGAPAAPVAPPPPFAPSPPPPAAPGQPVLPGLPPVGPLPGRSGAPRAPGPPPPSGVTPPSVLVPPPGVKPPPGVTPPPGLVPPPGRTPGGSVPLPPGAVPALPGALAPPNVAAHAGRQPGRALPGAYAPSLPLRGQPVRVTDPGGPIAPRLPGATAAAGGPGPAVAPPAVPPPPALPGQSAHPSTRSTRAADPPNRAAAGPQRRAPKPGAPALPGSTASRAAPGTAGTPVLGSGPPAGRAAPRRTEERRTTHRRADDILHVPGQADDDALWTVEAPPGPLAPRQPKLDQPPPTRT